MTFVRAVVERDLRLYMRGVVDLIGVWMFFGIAIAMLPLSIGPDPDILSRIAPGAAWAIALLASMLSLERVFAPDQLDGSLDLLLLHAPSPHVLVLAKSFAHWLVTGLPFVVLAPVAAIALGMEMRGVLPLAGALLIGTPALSLIGTLGAALTAPLRRGGILAALIVLPQTIPVLIFGTAAVSETLMGRDSGAYFSVLGAFTLAALALAPYAGNAALRAVRN
ncbi:MAG: heme exporter protein CcmB [Rhodospirillales bacterium]|nr:heme exporter protein CcmB [Rhodospirillales bacterium]